VNDPKPGSDEAIAQGCECPVMDNGHDRGYCQDENGEWIFVVNADCPLHGSPMVSRLMEAVGA
jgi:hypothetical protein